MTDHTKRHLAHGVHVALHTEPGKRAVKAATGVALTAATAVVGAAAAPYVVVGAAAYGLWRLFKK